MMRQKFFITHSWKDIEFAKKLYNDLKKNGLAGFFDERSVRFGESIPSRIEQGLEKCNVYIPVLSPDALKSKWCDWEINMAIMMNREGGRPHIIPVVAEKCTIPTRLRHLLYVDFVGRYDAALNDLLTKGFGLPVNGHPYSPPVYAPPSPPQLVAPPEPVKPNHLQKLQVITGGLILTILVCVGIYLALPQVLKFISSVQAPPTNVVVATATPNTSSFEITKPKDGAEVGVTEQVEGKSPHARMKHYLFVQQGANQFCQGLVPLSSNGSWMGNATFGGPGIGAGLGYNIFVIATESDIPNCPGLGKIPDGAISSNWISVKRK